MAVWQSHLKQNNAGTGKGGWGWQQSTWKGDSGSSWKGGDSGSSWKGGDSGSSWKGNSGSSWKGDSASSWKGDSASSWKGSWKPEPSASWKGDSSSSWGWKGDSKGKGNDDRSWSSSSWGKGSAGKGVSTPAMLMGMMKGKMMGAKGKGKGKGKRGAGHKLPRTRISDSPVLGEVLEWKGKYGWIKPSEPIQHEQAAKREGKIFVSQEDLVGVAELTPGRLCQFQLFSDPSGLGAEECLQA